MAIDLSKITINGERFTLSKSGKEVDAPDLLNVQIDSYKEFLQEEFPHSQRKNKGMQGVFMRNFPITDSRETDPEFWSTILRNRNTRCGNVRTRLNILRFFKG
jgi:DNA-directed RNA polymerase beta subunit